MGAVDYLLRKKTKVLLSAQITEISSTVTWDDAFPPKCISDFFVILQSPF